MLMARFLEGHAAESIAWLEKKQRREHLVRRPGYWIRVGFVMPLTFAGIFLYRGTGLRDLLNMISALGDREGISSLSEVIPFSEAGTVLKGAPLSYLCGAVFAAIVDCLRGFNILL
jgi:hypothetical protein